MIKFKAGEWEVKVQDVKNSGLLVQARTDGAALTGVLEVHDEGVREIVCNRLKRVILMGMAAGFESYAFKEMVSAFSSGATDGIQEEVTHQGSSEGIAQAKTEAG